MTTVTPSSTSPRVVGGARHRTAVVAAWAGRQTVAMRVLVIDSYDSFVYNLVQYLGELGARPEVVRNDEITVDEALARGADGVLLSPGPGRPEQSGIICDAIHAFAAVVLDHRGLAVHEHRRTDDLGAVDLSDRLVSEAHPEHGCADGGERVDRVADDPAVLGPTGSG